MRDDCKLCGRLSEGCPSASPECPRKGEDWAWPDEKTARLKAEGALREIFNHAKSCDAPPEAIVAIVYRIARSALPKDEGVK